MTINEIEEIDLTLEKSEMPALASNLWIEPWWAGVVLMYDGIPIIAGPIASRPVETETSLRIMAAGPRSLFAMRGAIKDMDKWSDLDDLQKKRDWSSYGKIPAGAQQPEGYYNRFKDMTYPSLLRMVIAESMGKHGGHLPIVFKVPLISHVDPPTESDGAGGTKDIAWEDRPHSLHIHGTQMAEATVEAQIEKLINVENGPDIFFKPTLTSRYSLQWEFWSGSTDEDNELPNDSDTIWDTTAQTGHITDMSVNYLGAKMTNRAFVRASEGSGDSVTVKVAEDTSKMTMGYPLLESYEVVTVSGTKALQDKAKENLRANDKANHQINATIRANGTQKLGTFWPGEYARLVTSGWYGLRNGETRAKIVGMSGDFTNNVSIRFKETEVL